jgi:hypothetical protein
MPTYCAYVKKGSGGPLCFKSPTGIVVAAFTNLELFQNFLSRQPSPLPAEAVEISKLQTAAFPMPEQWSMVTQALLFDNVEVIDCFLADASTFPYAKHTIALSSHSGV